MPATLAAAFLALSLTAAACAGTSTAPAPEPSPPESESPSPEPSESESPSPEPSESGGPTEGFPQNTAFEFCVAIRPQESITILDVGLTGFFDPGTYTGTFQIKGGGSVSGTGQPEGKLLEVPVTISQFAVYQNLRIVGPGGVNVDLRNLDEPLDINEKTDKPNDCHPDKLDVPSGKAPGGGAGNAKGAIRDFMPVLGSIEQGYIYRKNTAFLDDVVIERYGAEQCFQTIREDRDPSAKFEFVRIVSGPGPYVYSSDGLSATVRNVYGVDVKHTSHSRTSEAVIHLHVDQGNVTWFTDCGDPK